MLVPRILNWHWLPHHQEMIFELKVRGQMEMENVELISSVEGVKAVNWVAEAGENVG